MYNTGNRRPERATGQSEAGGRAAGRRRLDLRYTVDLHVDRFESLAQKVRLEQEAGAAEQVSPVHDQDSR